jgi:PknH-like extracellular domain
MGCGLGNTQTGETPTTTKTFIPRPVVERELDGLLLNAEQVTIAMAAPPMTVSTNQSTMADNSAIMDPKECLIIDGAAEAPVFATSGFSAARDQTLHGGDPFTHYAKQAVVLFPMAEKARALFDTFAKQWSACRAYSHTQSGTEWTVGPITNENDALRTIATQQQAAAPGWACGRATALRNNVIIDVNTCSANPADSALKIAEQIGAKVAAL